MQMNFFSSMLGKKEGLQIFFIIILFVPEEHEESSFIIITLMIFSSEMCWVFAPLFNIKTKKWYFLENIEKHFYPF